MKTMREMTNREKLMDAIRKATKNNVIMEVVTSERFITINVDPYEDYITDVTIGKNFGYISDMADYYLNKFREGEKVIVRKEAI